MNRTNSKSTCLSVQSGGAPPHSKTLARWLWGRKIRQVLECAAAAALSIPREVHGPNAFEKTKGGSMKDSPNNHGWSHAPRAKVPARLAG